MISEEQLQEWERIANEATEGPWYRCLLDICKLDLEECCLNKSAGRTCSDSVVNTLDKRNLDFFAAAREVVPALIAEVRRLNAQLPDSISQVFYHGKTIMEDKVAQLEKEADWLAKELGNSHCHISTIGPDCPDYHDRDSKNCHNCWREVARKAVESE